MEAYFVLIGRRLNAGRPGQSQGHVKTQCAGNVSAAELAQALAQCLSKLGGGDVPRALRLYVSLRLARASRVQAASNENKIRFHLPDGPQQRERDTQVRDAATDWFINAMSWIYGHDAA